MRAHQLANGQSGSERGLDLIECHIVTVLLLISVLFKGAT